MAWRTAVFRVRHVVFPTVSSAMGAPKFYSIQSLAHPGYYLTQRGTQVVLAALNTDSPYQLWYIDESWKYLGNCAVALINHGSKTALDSQSLTPSGQKAKLTSYDPVVRKDTLLWVLSGTFDTDTRIRVAGNLNLALSLGEDTPKCPPPVENIAAVVGDSLSTSYGYQWQFIPYGDYADPFLSTLVLGVWFTVYNLWLHAVPLAFNIQNSWATQNLTYKAPRTNITLKDTPCTQNDEFNVIGISSKNNTQNDMIWYRVPAGGQEDTNDYTSFIVINKSTGLVLKGSSKRGEKVHLKEYDVLDYDFVWAENRAADNTQQYVSINLSKTGSTDLHWYFQPQDAFQNSPYYHPLTLRSNDGVQPHTWKFIPVV